MIFTRLIVLLTMSIVATPPAWADDPCGGSVDDWCSSPKAGACGRHMNENDCRADDKCVAIRYSGESLVACHWDQRGFADNCPAVGCQER